MLNNPLSYTDPSGFTWWTKWRRPIFALIAAVVVPHLAMEAMQYAAAEGSAWAFEMLNTSVTFGGSTSLANVISVTAGGFAAGGIASGNLEGAVAGAFQALATFGVGEIFNAHGGVSHLNGLESAGHVASHAVVGCAGAVLSGGNCKAGAMAQGFSALAGYIPGMEHASLPGRMVVGGVASKLGGGVFASGALSAAFEYLYNANGGDQQGKPMSEGAKNAAGEMIVGFGDTMSFGATRAFRNHYDIGKVDYTSAAYRFGEGFGILYSTGLGAGAGLVKAGSKGAGLEFSHWIPSRMGGPRNMLNGNFVTTEVHALSDPFRYKFMPRSWKLLNEPFHPMVQQWVRIPYTLKGAGFGLGYGVGATKISQ